MGVEGAYPLLIALWLLPMASAIALWAFGPQLRTAAGPIGAGIVGVCFALALFSWPDAVQRAHGALGAHLTLFSWGSGFDFGLLWDPLSLTWTLIITGVGFLIITYAIGYMEGDGAYARFFAYMTFFIFAMLTLVLSDNFVGLLVGWGGVGLASFFLIGFYIDRKTAVAAARKAFVINVVGDVGLMFAILVIVTQVGSTTYAETFARLGQFSNTALVLACVGIFIGCAAKSAQVPLHSWLPDAMEGPTPVSALIHAATMVTAGVYLIARCWPMWNASPDARDLAGSIGGLTALMGAILGCAQWDIKRILAYSTMSQIGYMVMGVGVGAYDAGVLHFLTHAFFKAQLFLGAGLVIHALANEQDVRKMGGLRTKMPFAFWAMLVGVLAICGIPPFSGFFSKDAVIYGALEHGHPYLYAIGVLTAAITAYYMFRLILVTFFGTYRGEVDPSDLGIRHPELAGMPPHAAPQAHHSHQPGPIMNVPVAILMIPTTAFGWLAIGPDSPWERFFGQLFAGGTHVEKVPASIGEGLSTLIVLALVLVGIGLAYLRYGTSAAREHAVERLRTESVHMPPVLANAFYFDAAIDALFVRPAQALGRFMGRVVDPIVIDGAVREAAIVAVSLGNRFRMLQGGLVRGYALTIVVGVICVIAYYAVMGAGR
ncbi:MAG TPA: NADH-quinone oxidoreductase subunit L [Candidatus Binatia bacterium]|nr:NADH-quinone oxidoreductase subunit L [Candidatus Binatia bacterium]